MTTIELMLKQSPQALAAELGPLVGLDVYSGSLVPFDSGSAFLGRRGLDKHLGLIYWETRATRDIPFEGSDYTVKIVGTEVTARACPTTAANAASLRQLIPALRPKQLGLRKSAGCGDRLGLATPGHIRAIRGTGIEPIFAQQSVRENARTGRTPQQVADDALWGVLQEGWGHGYGADADHLKTTGDIDSFVRAGYTFYTFDPGEFVDNEAQSASHDRLADLVLQLPWDALASTPADLSRQLADRRIDIGDGHVTIAPVVLRRAAAKYGKAVAHAAALYRHLAAAGDFEVEVSVDETESETTVPEHVYIAHELKRLGVRWVSLAPRYSGRFEKGVDFIGDLARFESSFARHAAVARTFGPYKLSLHSGSDKFSVYPVAARLAGDLIHLKTAGTSYLEALRAVASSDAALFRDVLRFALSRYGADRASYHVSADAARVPDVKGWPDNELHTLLDHFDARQVLHVTFGSVIQDAGLRDRLFTTLRRHEETYYEMLQAHFRKHLAPFQSSGTQPAD